MGNNENAIIVPFSVHLQNQMTEEQALIDSRATENFLDYQTIKCIRIRT
jgi:hypothetical protein